MIEQCYKRHKTTVNPIIEWQDSDVWNFIHEYNIPYCKLYDEGFYRIGCIGCPMSRFSGRSKGFARFPKFKNSYLMAFDKMIKERERKGLKQIYGETAEDVFHWWMEDGVISGQINLFDEEEAEDE